MNQELIEELREMNALEKQVLHTGKPVLSYFVKEPDSMEVDKEKVIRQRVMIDVLRQVRFVEFPDHSHNFLEITYMCSGSTTHIINKDTELVLQKEDLLILKQGASHAVKAAGYDDLAIRLMILPEFLQYPLSMLKEDTVLKRFIEGSLRGEDGIEDYLHFHLQDLVEAQNLLENMVITILRDKRNSQRLLQATMGVLLLELSPRTDKITIGTPSDYEQQIVLDALAYIESNYQEATLDEFCRQTKHPAYYVSRLMKRYSPYTFTKCLQRRRLTQAGYLLTQTLVPVEEIVTLVGYENSSHFHRLFKGEYGMTPKEYRKRYQDM